MKVGYVEFSMELNTLNEMWFEKFPFENPHEGNGSDMCEILAIYM